MLEKGIIVLVSIASSNTYYIHVWYAPERVVAGLLTYSTERIQGHIFLLHLGH